MTIMCLLYDLVCMVSKRDIPNLRNNVSHHFDIALNTKRQKIHKDFFWNEIQELTINS